MRTPTSSSPSRAADAYPVEKQAKPTKQETVTKPSPAEVVRTGIDNIANIIEELRSFDVNTIQRRSDPRMKVITGRINDIIAGVFGRNTEEYDDYVIYTLDTLPITIGGSWYPLPEVREGYHKGIQSAISKLNSLLNAQKKKLETITATKPASPAAQQSNVNQVLPVKEKVSLVNLRGKIKSRESIFFSQTQPKNGNGSETTSIFPGNDFPENISREVRRENKYVTPRVEEKTIAGDYSKTGSATPEDNKNVVSLENLEEKLKKLEEEMPILEELQLSPVGRGHESEELGQEEVPLTTLMAKLNQIVSHEPEYLDAYNKLASGSEEKAAAAYRSVIDEEISCSSLAELDQLASSGLGAEEELLIIDGDSVLSSDSNFIEALEAGHELQDIKEPTHLDIDTINVLGGKKRISLEALEEKLREFEENENSKEQLPDLDQTFGEEVLLIESSSDLPDEMMSEFAKNTGRIMACEEEINGEEILVIDGDEEISVGPVSLELIDESPHEENLMDAREEVLVIECNNGLPEDVADELPYDEDICESQEEDLGKEAQDKMPTQSNDLSLVYPEHESRLIIDLFSRARPYDLALCDRDNDTRKEVILEDLRARLDDFSPSQPAQEFLNAVQCYDVDEREVLPSDDKARGDSAETCSPGNIDSIYEHPEESSIAPFFGYDFPISTQIDERTDDPLVCVSLEHEVPGIRFLKLTVDEANRDALSGLSESASLQSNRESKTSDAAVDDEFLELLEISVYGETSSLDGQRGFLFSDGEEIVFYDTKLDVVGDDVFSEPLGKAHETEAIEEKTHPELSEQLLPKEMVFLFDQEYVTPVASTIGLVTFESVLLENDDEERLAQDVGELEACVPITLPVVDDSGPYTYNAFEEVTTREALPVVISEELMKESLTNLTKENVTIGMEWPESIPEADHLDLIDEELITMSEQQRHINSADLAHFGETVLLDTDDSKVTTLMQHDDDQAYNLETLAESDCESALSCVEEDLAIESLQYENTLEIPELHEMGELAQQEERRESNLLDSNEIISKDDHEALERMPDLDMVVECEAFDEFESRLGGAELLSLEAFEKHQIGKDHNVTMLRADEISTRDTILLEALEEMLSNLEPGIQEQSHNHPVQSIIRNDPRPEDEEVLVVESHKEPTKKAVLIKTNEERINPFAVTDLGKERAHSKTLRADDLQAQIGELRYRIDDLKTFDVDSIKERFDPRVRALGDTVNNTLAEIFGRNTPAYWQHALPSLDSLPVVVGGPKLSPEELRDAYRRRINDAISKVNITIDVLEAKLGNLQDKGSGGQVLFFAPKETKYPDIQSLR